MVSFSLLQSTDSQVRKTKCMCGWGRGWEVGHVKMKNFIFTITTMFWLINFLLPSTVNLGHMSVRGSFAHALLHSQTQMIQIQIDKQANAKLAQLYSLSIKLEWKSSPAESSLEVILCADCFAFTQKANFANFANFIQFIKNPTVYMCSTGY